MPLPDVPLDYLNARHPVFEQLSNFQGITTPIAADRIRRARAAYFGMITDLDRMVGVLLDELKRSGQMERTLVVYTSDHGEMLDDNGLWFKNVLENAARIPLILAGAGLPSGRSVEMPVMHVDMVATMLELAGVARDPKHRGVSLLPLAQRQSVELPRTAYSESHSEGNCTGSFYDPEGPVEIHLCHGIRSSGATQSCRQTGDRPGFEGTARGAAALHPGSRRRH
jgi:choline-sulfatase